jgi:glycosyltransferase involved in cell wall biosynthesis
MRILQVTSSYYPYLESGGLAQKTQELSSGLAKLDHEVRVITFDSQKTNARKARTVDDVDVQYVPWIGTANRRSPISLPIIQSAVDWADIIHCYGLYNLLCPSAAFLAQRSRRPFLLEPLGMFVPRLRKKLTKRLYHQVFTFRMLARASKVIATSPIEMEELSAVVAEDKLVLRRDGVDLNKFRKLPPRTVFRDQLGLADAERLILFLGRISPIKNLEQLIEAFHLADLETAQLVLVGPVSEPEYAARLRSMIGCRDLNNRVLLTGPLYHERKLAALAAADLFVLPSIYESFGIAAAEAVAARIPVLLTETCGIAPLIHARAGLAVPLSPVALADGLRALLEDVGLREQLTCRTDEVAAELSMEEPVQQMDRLYRNILGERGH